MNKMLKTISWLCAFGIVHLTGCNAVDWSIGDPTLADAFSNSNNVMTVSSVMGTDVENVTVTLYEYDCETLVPSPNTNAIQLQNETLPSVNAGTFSYEMLLTLSEVETSTFFESANSQGNSTGDLKFCTRIITSIDETGLQVSFKQTRFTVTFNMTHADITPISVTAQEDDIEDETSEENALLSVNTEYGVRLFTCDSSAAEISNATYLQNDDVYLCLHPTEDSPAVETDEVIIQNFQLMLTSDTGATAYMPVTFGSDTWNPDPLTTVTKDVPDVTSSRLLIKLRLVTQLFDLNPDTVQTITISGTTHLEFRGTRRRLQANTGNIDNVSGETSIVVKVPKTEEDCGTTLLRGSSVVKKLFSNGNRN